MSELLNKLTDLAKQRKQVDDVSFDVKRMEVELQQTQEYKNLMELKALEKELKETQSTLEDDIRNLAVQSFDGENKTPVDGVKIKMFDVVEVTNEKQALEWASVNMPKAVKLDRRTFDSAVKKLELPFVVVKEEPKAQIDSDLSKYL